MSNRESMCLIWSYIWHYNLEQNICKVFQVLAQPSFTKSKMELDNHQKVNIRVASRVAERL